MSIMVKVGNKKIANIDGRRLAIVGGPNKDAIFDACKYAYSEDWAIPNLKFQIVLADVLSANGKHVPIYLQTKDLVIRTIGHEDGSGNSFLLEGFCKVDTSTFGYESFRFSAWYHAQRREGHITFNK